MGQALLDFLVGAAIIVAPQHNFALAAGSLAVKVGLSLKRKKSDLAKNGERHGSSSKPVTLQWDDLRVAFQNKKSKKTKLVFEGVSGRAHPGRSAPDLPPTRPVFRDLVKSRPPSHLIQC